MRTMRCEARRRLVGALAALCLVLQPLPVFAHLAGSEHELVRESRHAGHSHAGHPHGHDRTRGMARGDDAQDPHRPHPVEDHLELLAQPSVPPTFVPPVLAPLPTEPELRWVDARSRAVSDVAGSGPRSPPPRTDATPRAPPVVS